MQPATPAAPGQAPAHGGPLLGWRGVGWVGTTLTLLSLAVAVVLESILLHDDPAPDASVAAATVSAAETVFGSVAGSYAVRLLCFVAFGSVLVAVPLTHGLAGHRLHNVASVTAVAPATAVAAPGQGLRWRVFQPFRGGSRFVLLQAFGWALWAVALVAGCYLIFFAGVSGLRSFGSGVITVPGVLAVLSQVAVLTSLRYFDRSVENVLCAPKVRRVPSSTRAAGAAAGGAGAAATPSAAGRQLPSSAMARQQSAFTSSFEAALGPSRAASLMSPADLKQQPQQQQQQKPKSLAATAAAVSAAAVKSTRLASSTGRSNSRDAHRPGASERLFSSHALFTEHSRLQLHLLQKQQEQQQNHGDYSFRSSDDDEEGEEEEDSDGSTSDEDEDEDASSRDFADTAIADSATTDAVGSNSRASKTLKPSAKQQQQPLRGPSRSGSFDAETAGAPSFSDSLRYLARSARVLTPRTAAQWLLDHSLIFMLYHMPVFGAIFTFAPLTTGWFYGVTSLPFIAVVTLQAWYYRGHFSRAHQDGSLAKPWARGHNALWDALYRYFDADIIVPTHEELQAAYDLRYSDIDPGEVKPHQEVKPHLGTSNSNSGDGESGNGSPASPVDGSLLPWRPYPTATLDPSQPYLFCFHPHGIYPMTAFWATRHEEFRTRFPGVEIDVLGATVLTFSPGLREVFLATGGRDVSRTSILNCFAQRRSCLLIPGGQREMKYADYYDRDFVLYAKHQGFIRLALQAGVPLVPVFSFGENQILHNMRLPGLQIFLYRTFGIFMPMYPHGRLYSLMPNQTKVTVVFGAPVFLPKIAQPTVEEIAAFHFEYYGRVHELFEQHKAAAGFPDSKLTLEL
jgi:hypothetical protein